VAKFSDFMFRYGKYIGGAFTVLVLALIIYGNVFATSVTPTNFRWEKPPVLYICGTAPAWVQPGSEALTKALTFWSHHGYDFASVEAGPCTSLCLVRNDKGEEISVTCNPGKVTLDLMDKWWSEEHAGVCRFQTGVEVLGASNWTTMLVPKVIMGSDEIDAPMLPADAEALVLTHETGHCLAGLAHNLGPSLGCGGGCRLNPKTGHIMNPNLYKTSWGDEALPNPTKLEP